MRPGWRPGREIVTAAIEMFEWSAAAGVAVAVSGWSVPLPRHLASRTEVTVEAVAGATTEVVEEAVIGAVAAVMVVAVAGGADQISMASKTYDPPAQLSGDHCCLGYRRGLLDLHLLSGG
jgi:hypothetical protein